MEMIKAGETKQGWEMRAELRERVRAVTEEKMRSWRMKQKEKKEAAKQKREQEEWRGEKKGEREAQKRKKGWKIWKLGRQKKGTKSTDR